jgi:endo-1,4-beta-xylanase
VAVIGALAVAAGLLISQPATAQDGDVLIHTDFSSGTTEGWFARGDVTLEVTPDEHLLIDGRTDTWTGAAHDITEHVQVGARYELSLRARLPEGSDPALLRTTVQRDAGGQSSYDSVVWNREVTDAAWTDLTGTYATAGAADALHFYIESDASLTPILIDDFTMTRLADPDIEDLPELKDVLADHFVFGAAVENPEVVGKPSELLAKHFGQLTVGNQMKPDAIQPQEGVFDFSRADQIVEFAEAEGMQIWGHTLLWHNQTAPWWFEDQNGQPLTNSPEHQQLMIDRLEAHIGAIADHYGDRVWAWDVVNEVVDPGEADGLRHSRWYEIFDGPDYIAHAFRIAREAFPDDVKLFINDYNTEFPDKRQAMYDLVESMLADGVPIEGVGHQAHVSLDRPVGLLADTIDAFAALPVLQTVTELDVSISRSQSESLPTTPPERLIEQGWYYKELFDMLREKSDLLESVTVWGLYDAVSWLRTWPIDRPHEAPLIFDDYLQAKPAYWGIVDPDRLEPIPELPPAPRIDVPRAATPPEIDGEVDDVWSEAVTVTTETHVEGSADGAKADVSLLWTDGALYALLDVADPVLDESSPNVWEQDSIELFVNPGNTKHGAYGPRDGQYRVSYTGLESLNVGAEAGELTSATVVTATGYRVEMRVALPDDHEVGAVIGFDAQVNDATGGVRTAAHTWHDASGGSWQSTRGWGEAALVEAPAEPTCAVDFLVWGVWPGGFVAGIELTSTADEPVDGWELTWSFTGEEQVRNGWNAEFTQVGQSVTASAPPYNTTITPNRKVHMGFVGTNAPADALPAFALNGAACAAG